MDETPSWKQVNEVLDREKSDYYPNPSIVVQSGGEKRIINETSGRISDSVNNRSMVEDTINRKVKPSTAGSLRRKLPMVPILGTALGLASGDASASVPILDSADSMDYDRSYEPDTVEYQERVAAERLMQAIKARRGK